MRIFAPVPYTPEKNQESLQWQRLRTDQLTEASERLNGVMENVFEYERKDNDFWFQGQALRPIFERGVRNAAELVSEKPQYALELARRQIELGQLNEQLELRRHVDWYDPVVLVHISPTPDAVLEGSVDLNAYDTVRKKIMVRITEPTTHGVRVTSLSLDRGDRVALQAVGDMFGVAIPDAATSEDILAMSFVAAKSEFGGVRPAQVIRERYDQALAMQYGGKWYAGRQDTSVVTTIQKLLRFPKLLDRHTDEIFALKRQFGDQFRWTPQYEQATYNYLAAVEQAYTTGVIATKLSDAGGAAQAAGVMFARSDCPSGGLSHASAETVLATQGIGEHHRHFDRCQACLTEKMVGPCRVCDDCEQLDNRGVDLQVVRREALARQALREAMRQPGTEPKRKPLADRAGVQLPEAFVQNMFGPRAILRTYVVVGDMQTDVVDRVTGQVLREKVTKKDFVLAS